MRNKMIIYTISSTLINLVLDYLRWDCPEIYKVLDKADLDVAELERVMEKLVEQASLFEVITPEFKTIKQLRKELKMAKVNLTHIYVNLF